MSALRPMTESEYGAWLAESISAYAREKVASGQWTEHESRELSTQELKTQDNNTGAQAFYAKLGFQPTNISLFKAIEAEGSRPC